MERESDWTIVNEYFSQNNENDTTSKLITSSIIMLNETLDMPESKSITQGTISTIQHELVHATPLGTPEASESENFDGTDDVTFEDRLTLENFSSQSPDREIGPKDVGLKDLLKTWELEVLSNRFTEEKINIAILKVIKPEDIDKLICNFPIGTQVLFKHKLEQWRNDKEFTICDNLSYSGTPSIAPVYDTFYLSSPSSSRTDSPVSSRYSPYESSRTPDRITLLSIINESAKGEMLQIFYSKYGKFQEAQRNILINLICQYFSDKNLHMSLITSYKLEREICEQFTSEKLEFYRTGKRGKLYNRCSNLKSQLKPICLEPIILPEITLGQSQLVPELDAEACERSLKFDNLSIEEFDRLWKACSKYRLKQISKINTTYEILEKWPYYASPSGFRLIDMDFCYLFNSKSILDEWEKYSTKLSDFLYREGNIKDRNIQTKLRELKLLPNVTDDGKCAVLLWALHGFLTPSQKSVKKDNSGKKVFVRHTIKDSQDAFLFVGKSIQELDDHINFISENSIQPFIMAVGNDISDLQQIIVYFDKIKYSFSNILRAVDICYKIFHLFNLQYPIAATNFYKFIEHFYQMHDTNKEKNTKVVILINELLTDN